MKYDVREKEIILDELAWLHLVLQWSTAHPSHSKALTPGERIMVNQQRAALFRELEQEPTGFVQTDGVLEKINHIYLLILKNKWKPKE